MGKFKPPRGVCRCAQSRRVTRLAPRANKVPWLVEVAIRTTSWKTVSLDLGLTFFGHRDAGYASGFSAGISGTHCHDCLLKLPQAASLCCGGCWGFPSLQFGVLSDSHNRRFDHIWYQTWPTGSGSVHSDGPRKKLEDIDVIEKRLEKGEMSLACKGHWLLARGIRSGTLPNKDKQFVATNQPVQNSFSMLFQFFGAVVVFYSGQAAFCQRSMLWLRLTKIQVKKLERKAICMGKCHGLRVCHLARFSFQNLSGGLTGCCFQLNCRTCIFPGHHSLVMWFLLAGNGRLKRSSECLPKAGKTKSKPGNGVYQTIRFASLMQVLQQLRMKYCNSGAVSENLLLRSYICIMYHHVPQWLASSTLSTSWWCHSIAPRLPEPGTTIQTEISDGARYLKPRTWFVWKVREHVGKFTEAAGESRSSLFDVSGATGTRTRWPHVQ